MYSVETIRVMYQDKAQSTCNRSVMGGGGTTIVLFVEIRKYAPVCMHLSLYRVFLVLQLSYRTRTTTKLNKQGAGWPPKAADSSFYKLNIMCHGWILDANPEAIVVTCQTQRPNNEAGICLPVHVSTSYTYVHAVSSGSTESLTSKYYAPYIPWNKALTCAIAGTHTLITRHMGG